MAKHGGYYYYVLPELKIEWYGTYFSNIGFCSFYLCYIRNG
jgi:hypothetical protein